MRLNYDLIRDIMLKIEFETDGHSNISPTGLAEEYFNNYDLDVILYHIKYIRDAELIEPASDTIILDLTPNGHEFLNNIRSASIWKATKEKVYSAASSVSLALLVECAKRAAASSIGL